MIDLSVATRWGWPGRWDEGIRRESRCDRSGLIGSKLVREPGEHGHELVCKGLTAKGDPREVVADEQARYSGARVSWWASS